MTALIIRVLVNAAALWAAIAIVDGIELTGDSTTDKTITLLAVAVIFGVINAIIKPIVKLISLPLFILTLGLITFVINAFMLWLTSWLSTLLGLGFDVDGFWSAFLGALIITFVSWLLDLIIPD